MIQKLILSILFICSYFFSTLVYSEEAIVCNNCETAVKAELFAKRKANSLQCSSFFSENISCTSQSKIVIFVDRQTETPYKYNVYHDPSAPWEVQASRISLSGEAQNTLVELMKFYKNLSESINGASISSNSILALNNEAFPRSYFNEVSSNTCPSNTALGALLNPNRLEEIRTIATLEIGTNLVSKSNSNNLKAWARNQTVGLTVKGVNYQLTDSSPSSIPSYVVTFNETERQTSVKDYLAYNIAINGYDTQNLPVLNFELSNDSRIAGYSLSALKGKYGSLMIENDCLREKFEEAENQGILTSKTTPIPGSGGGGVPEPNEPRGNDNIGSSCSIVEFYQSGNLIYIFRNCR